MQTFLPYPDFLDTMKCLDRQRLGKQRIESRQIYNIVSGQAKSNAWKHHPAVLMWKGFADALALYHNVCINEWINRGYKNTMSLLPISQKILFPYWLGDNNFHKSHRQTLLYKNFEWYSQFGWKEEPKYEYFWPVRIKNILTSLIEK